MTARRAHLIPAALLGAALATLAAPALAQKTSTGTAFAITADGELITNEHVVTGCSSVIVQQGTVRHTAQVVATDANDDLALLRLSQKTATFASFRKTPALRPGEQAITYGFPLAGALTTEGNLTIGYVSALRGLQNSPKYIQITTPVQAGNSGGPLLDNSANIIGVVAAKLNVIKVLRETGDMAQNVNFAVAPDVAKQFLVRHKVRLTEVASETDLRPADIGDKAKAFTYFVECRPGTVARVSTEPSRPDRSERRDEEPRREPGEREAQRAAFYEADGDRQMRRFRGSAQWRMQTAREEVAIRADIEIPQRIGAELSLRRNTDSSLAASHVIEIRFRPDQAGEVSGIRGILMREGDGARGVPLTGVTVKAGRNAFLVGLSTGENEQRNVRLLRDAGIIDITLTLENGTRAVLSVDKGTTGDRIFTEAMERWSTAAVTRRPPPPRETREPPPTQPSMSDGSAGGSVPSSR
jgi:trypsin-like peptidase